MRKSRLLHHRRTCVVEDKTLEINGYYIVYNNISLNEERLVCVQCFVSWEVRVIAQY